MIFPGEEWEAATPESQGVDPAALRAAIEHLRKHVGRDGVDELFIARNGYAIWQGPHVDRMHGVWSVTKSFTSTALGLLIDDGKATLETRAREYLPEMADTYPDVTLRHFATMTSGYRAVGDEPQGSYTHGPSATPFAPFPAPLFQPPGTHFAYWDSAMNQFAHVLTRIAGEPLRDLLERRIAEPIGIEGDRWSWGEVDSPEGIPVNGGAGNLSRHVVISARELARLGHLFLNRGRWNGRQLLGERWVEQATRPQVPASTPMAHDAVPTGPGIYGYNWWANGIKPDGKSKWPGAPPGTFAASGFNNNKCFVVPESDMVVVRMGLDGNVPDAVWSDFFARLGG